VCVARYSLHGVLSYMLRLRRPPAYVLTFVGLVFGILLGGVFTEMLSPVARGTALFIRVIVALVPLLIVVALSPAIATLVRRGLAGRFAASVILWYLLSSAAAGLLGLVISSLIFGIPFTSDGIGAWTEAVKMFRAFGEQPGASLPLLAIVVAIVLGVVAVRVEPLYSLLRKIESGIAGVGGKVGYAMVPLVFLFGISIGVRFGARLGMGHYVLMTVYTAVLCFVWWLFYVFVIVRHVARRRVARVLTEYYVPTAVFAAGTCSSMATLPVNLANAKQYGIRDEVADFVLPIGAVVNLDASTLMYMAYAPFVLSFVFGIEVSWTLLLVAWPALVLFTVAAPGLPAGIGTALWSATLFASMVGLTGQTHADFVATWVALSGGLPDMFRTATNCTGDGFTAMVFDSFFERFFAKRSGVSRPDVTH
jgi:Na+/H+-dicarboxylate symporter